MFGLLRSVPEISRTALRRDLPAIAVRGTLLVLAVSLGGQLVQELGGSDSHVATLRAAPAIGLLLSMLYSRRAQGRSPLAMIFTAEAASMVLLGSLAFLGSAGALVGDALFFTLVATASVALAALTLPLIATVYGLVYPAVYRARLVAYGRMVSGIVSVAAAWGFGLLFTIAPGSPRVCFPILAAIGLAVAWYYSRMPIPAVQAPQKKGGRSAWDVLRNDHMFRRFQLFQFVLGFANLGAIPVVDLYVRRELGLSMSVAVMVVTHGMVIQTVILLTVRLQGTIFDRIGVVRHRVLTSCVLGLAYLTWAAAEGLPLAILASTLTGLAMSGGQIIWMIGSLSFAEPEDLTTYSSIHTVLTGVRGVLAPAFGVWVMQSEALALDHRTFFIATAVLIFLSALGHARWVDLGAREKSE